MASDARRLSQDGPAPSGYPQLDQLALARLTEKLAEVVSLLHAGRLSSLQVREFTSSLNIQTANCEKLHRVALRNSDEPAFVARLTPTPSDD